MKRSAQVALVLMGVTGTAATAAYMMPARADCRPRAAAATPAPEIAPGVRPRVQDDCARRSTRSWGSWNWHSNSSYRGSYGSSSNRSPTAVSTALTSSGRSSSSTSTSSYSSSSSTSRGGFGSSGHSFSSGS